MTADLVYEVGLAFVAVAAIVFGVVALARLRRERRNRPPF